MLEEVPMRHDVEDTDEMVQWKSINQEEVDGLWKTEGKNGGAGLGDIQS